MSKRVPASMRTRRLFPFLTKVIADSAYRGPRVAAGFTVLPKRWIVGRTFAWLGRCRRLANDFENLARTAIAFLWLASIRLFLRRLTRDYS